MKKDHQSYSEVKIVLVPPWIEANQFSIFFKLPNIGHCQTIEEVHQGDHHDEDEEDKEGKGCWSKVGVEIYGEIGEFKLPDEHGDHFDQAEPGPVEVRIRLLLPTITTNASDDDLRRVIDRVLMIPVTSVQTFGHLVQNNEEAESEGQESTGKE